MLLGLDLGTTNVKALLVERGGRVAGRGAAPVRLIHLPDGGVEQDIEEIFSAALSATAQAGAGGDLSAVEAIGVSAQGGALQMLDGDARPLGQVVSWLDARGKAFDRQVTQELGRERLAALTGHPAGTMALGQLLRLRAESPEVLAGTNGVGFVGDVIVSRLCGRRAHDATSLSCAVLFNPSLRSAEAEMLRRVGVAEGQLPDLICPREAAGGLLPAVARRSGLPVGVPVAPAVHDQYAAALGVGAVSAGDVMFGAGTAWVLLAVTDRLMPPAGGVGFSCTHVVEGLFGQILSMGNGGSAVTWALKLLGLDAAGPDEIDRMLASVPPGAEGQRFWPFLAPTGGTGLAAGTAGRLDGLRLGHSPAHLLRAVVEGLAFELRRYLGFLADAGTAVGRLVMCGGAAASGVTPRIVADVTGVPLACAAESDTGALGAAMLARGLLEPRASLAEISAAMAPDARALAPGADAGLYARLFRQYCRSLPLAGGSY